MNNAEKYREDKFFWSKDGYICKKCNRNNGKSALFCWFCDRVGPTTYNEKLLRQHAIEEIEKLKEAADK